MELGELPVLDTNPLPASPDVPQDNFDPNRAVPVSVKDDDFNPDRAVPHDQDIAAQATDFLTKVRAGEVQADPQHIFQAELTAQAGKSQMRRFWDKSMAAGAGLGDAAKKAVGGIEDYYENTFVPQEKAYQALPWYQKIIQAPVRTLKGLRDLTVGGFNAAAETIPTAIDLATSIEDLPISPQGAAGAATGLLLPKETSEQEALHATLADIIRGGVSDAKSKINKVTGADPSSLGAHVAENAVPLLMIPGAGVSTAGALDTAAGKIVGATEKAGAMADKAVAKTASTAGLFGPSAARAGVGAALGGTFNHELVGALLGAATGHVRAEGRALQSLIDSKFEDVVANAGHVLNAPDGVPAFQAIKDAVEKETERAQAGVDRLTERMSPEDMKDAIDPNLDLADLTGPAKRVRQKMEDLKDLKSKLGVLESRRNADRFIYDSERYLTNLGLHTALGGSIGAGFTGATSATGDTSSMGGGTLYGLILGAAGSPFASREGIKENRITEGRNGFAAIGAQRIPTPDHPEYEGFQEAMGTMDDKAKTDLNVFNGFAAPLDTRIIPLTPDRLLAKASEEASGDQGGGMPPTEGSSAPSGFVGKDGNIYINSETWQDTGVAGHEVTHVLEEGLGSAAVKTLGDITSRMSDPKASPHYQAMAGLYLDAVRKSLANHAPLPDGHIASEALAEVGRIVLQDTPPELFWGGEHGGDIVKRKLHELASKVAPSWYNKLSVDPVFGTPYTRGDVQGMKKAFSDLGEQRGVSGQRTLNQNDSTGLPGGSTGVQANISNAVDALVTLGTNKTEARRQIQEALQAHSDAGKPPTVESLVKTALNKGKLSLLPNVEREPAKAPERFYIDRRGLVIDRLTGKDVDHFSPDNEQGHETPQELVDSYNNDNYPLPPGWTGSHPDAWIPEWGVDPYPDKKGVWGISGEPQRQGVGKPDKRDLHGEYPTREAAEEARQQMLADLYKAESKTETNPARLLGDLSEVVSPEEQSLREARLGTNILPHGLTSEENTRYQEIKNNPEPTTEEADEFSKLNDKIIAHMETRQRPQDAEFMPVLHSGFYSPLEKHLEDKMPNRVSPEQLSGILAKSPVKKAELEWTGINDLIDQAKKEGRQITKEEAVAFVRANTPEIQEVRKNDRAGEGFAVRETKTKGGHKAYDVVRGDGTIWGAEYGSLEEAMDARSRAESEVPAANRTKYSQYQLPGGENYRELLMTLPKRLPDIRREDGGFSVYDFRGNKLSHAETAKQAREQARDTGAPQDFTSSHFDEPNIVGHLRVNDRTLPDASKMLFAEEIQSDWAQKGRKEGYRNLSPEDEARAKELVSKNSLTPRERDELRALQPKLDAVPDMPFKGEAWKKLMLRNLIKHAVEEGYDSVGWTTGEQQAERYDLSKHVEKITATKNKDGTFDVIVHPKGESAAGTISKGNLRPEQISDFVGKDLADRIVNEAQPGGTDFMGLDLKVGDEGMKGFYDKELVNLANDIGKKYGTKVGITDINSPRVEVHREAQEDGSVIKSVTVNGEYKASTYGDESQLQKLIDIYRKDFPDQATVHQLPITEAMRQAVGEKGQPMFMPAPEKLQRMADQYGLKYAGEMMGKLHLFNDPTTKSTIAVKIDATPADLQAKLKASRDMFKGGLEAMPAPDKDLTAVVRDYAQRTGLQYVPHEGYAPLNEEYSKSIADRYEKLQHNPKDPATLKAYDAFRDGILGQYQTLLDHGYKIEPWPNDGQPYANSKDMLKDLRENKHLYYFKTEQGYGDKGGSTPENHPMLRGSGISFNGEEAPINDIFRGVHDALGHGLMGYQFGPRGEYNAFLAHASTLPPESHQALATETIGQNSWTNFGPHMRDAEGNIIQKGQPGYVELPDRPYTEQRAALLNFMPDTIMDHEVQGTNSRAVSPEEFASLRSLGQSKLDEFKQAQSPTIGLDKDWSSIRNQAWNEAQKDWGGIAIDTHTGKPLLGPIGKGGDVGKGPFGVTAKEPGQQTIEIPESASRAEFDRAMDQARKSFPQLEYQNYHLSVFHDNNKGTIDIDPTVIVPTAKDAEAVGAYTHAIGGAYDFDSGNGLYPPHVKSTALMPALPVQQDGTSKAWVGPNGDVIPLKGWHADYLRSHPDIAESWGIDNPQDIKHDMDKDVGIQAGAARVNISKGQMTVESTEKSWSKIRDSVMNLALQNADHGVMGLTVKLFDDGVKKVVSSDSAKIDADPKKIADMPIFQGEKPSGMAQNLEEKAGLAGADIGGFGIPQGDAENYFGKSNQFMPTQEEMNAEIEGMSPEQVREHVRKSYVPAKSLTSGWWDSKLSPEDREQVGKSLGLDIQGRKRWFELPEAARKAIKERYDNPDARQFMPAPEALPVETNDKGKVIGVPYALDKTPLAQEAGKGLKGEARDQSVANAYADRLQSFYDSIKDQPEIMAGKGWYSVFREKVASKLPPEDAQLFGQLLAATSPNTAVRDNFKTAVEAYNMFKQGKFDRHIEGYLDAIDKMGDGIDEGKLRHYLDKNDLIPVKENGKKFGMNSQRVLSAMAGKLYEQNPKALKMLQFARNLTGEDFNATIDMWAARTVRRLGFEGTEGPWRIQPKSEVGVKPNDFKTAQDAFRVAADRLGMEPEDLQAILWFAEKDLWDKNNWTKHAGRAKSDFHSLLDKTDITPEGLINAKIE